MQLFNSYQIQKLTIFYLPRLLRTADESLNLQKILQKQRRKRFENLSPSL